MHVQLQCQKGVLTEGGVFVDVITFEIEINVIVVCLSLHFWRLGGMPFPIAKLVEVWKLKHQVVQNCINPSKEKLQKNRFGLVCLNKNKKSIGNKEIVNFQVH